MMRKWTRPRKGLLAGVLEIRPTATALNCANLCRCGMMRKWTRPRNGLLEGVLEFRPTATALNYANLCRCGMMRKWTRPQNGILGAHYEGTFLLLRKVNPKGGKTVHLCNRAMPGMPLQALWQWSRPHAAAKVHPKGGKTVHLCNRAMPETPTQALWQW